jgi:SAM-dependent methyltransferase
MPGPTRTRGAPHNGMEVQARMTDPQAIKERTRQSWQRSAEAWYRWTPALETWLQPVTQALIEMARIKPGDRVLDVAAGAGEPAVTIAQRVGSAGSVVAIDNSELILEFAARRAKEQGVGNVEMRVMDGEALELSDDSFDAAVSRLGVIYFPDRVGALREVRRVLKSGARVAVAGLTSPATNPLSARTMQVLFRRSQLPPPAPGGPGPFSLGSEEAMRAALDDAGFADVRVRLVDAALRLVSAAEAARFQREAFAGMDDMLFRLSPDERDATWAEVAEQLGEFEREGSFEVGAQFIVGSGVA